MIWIWQKQTSQKMPFSLNNLCFEEEIYWHRKFSIISTPRVLFLILAMSQGKFTLLLPFCMKIFLTRPVLCISESCFEIKINLHFYFHNSLWCLKRFYEGLKGKRQCTLWKKEIRSQKKVTISWQKNRKTST